MVRLHRGKKGSQSLKTFFWGTTNKRVSLIFFVSSSLLLILFSISFLNLFSLFRAKQITSTPMILIGSSFGISIAALLFMNGLVKKQALLPLNKLYKASIKLGKGDFNIHTNIKANSQLKEIGDNFNKMIEALHNIEKEHREIDKTKTRFLSITSHELRSPMTPIKSQLQMLDQNYFGPLNKKQQKSIKIILRNANRLDNIIRDFLDVSRIEAARLKFNFKKVNIPQIIEEVIEGMKHYMPEKEISLITRISKTKAKKMPMIETDPGRVSQILRNLISNAIKFTEKKGKVEVNVKSEKNHLLFSIKDEGVGISAQDQTKLFEPFFQAEQTIYREQGGVGLGLAICRGIVLSQKGNIWVESQPGQGSTFYFTLPLKPVKKIKPIKLLFSVHEEIEKNLKTLFNETLGPIGSTELDNFKKRNKLIKTDLARYTDDLIEKGVLTKGKGNRFRREIGIICEA